MTETVVATYDAVDKVKNAEDDLRSTGIPSEKIHVDKDTRQIRVLVPSATKMEILEILNRHQPSQVQ